LGFGATLAGFVGKYPQLILLSENKGMVFGASFLMLALSYGALRFSKIQACPIDKKEDCLKTKSWSHYLFVLTLVMNLVGVFYAFLLPRLL
jgi:hypothetical protein